MFCLLRLPRNKILKEIITQNREKHVFRFFQQK